jgi:hypothetical protein
MIVFRARLPLAACILLPFVACGGTETDNPVIAIEDYESPERFAPEDPAPPGCVPIDIDEQPMLPARLPRSLVSDGTTVLGTDYRGLTATDGDGPPLVRGYIHELVQPTQGELWVAAIEPPALAQSELSGAAELEPELRLISLDVTNPAAPARTAQVALSGDYVRMRERDGVAWVLTARRSAEQRGCDAEENLCGYRYYEAVELRGYRPNAAGFELVGEAELPFERRVWFTEDGVVTATPDGNLHVRRWDAAGALMAPRVVPSGVAMAEGEPGDFAVGAAQLRGRSLSWVSRAANGRALSVFDLDSTAPSVSDLGGEASNPSSLSLFWGDKLWLNPAYGQGTAELWDVSGAAPVRMTLPNTFATLLPIEGARLEAQPGALVALGLERNDNGAESYRLLAIEGSTVSAVQVLDGSLSLYPGNRFPLPAGFRGPSDEVTWEVMMRGAGLPMGLDPMAPPGFDQTPIVKAFVAPTGGGAEAALVQRRGMGGVPGSIRLEVSADGVVASFDVSPGAQALLPTPSGVVVVAATPLEQCEQSGFDCAGYAPGVAVYDLSDEPRHVEDVPFPVLATAPVNEPWHVTVNWSTYDVLSERIAEPLGDRYLAFVADVDLSCTTEATCAELGLEPLPFAEAGVVGGALIDCPPDENPNCVPMPAPVPSVYGQGRRHYVYVLDLEAEAGPAWLELGASELESKSGNADRSSRFAAPRVIDGQLVVTRLERYSSAGVLLPRGQARFMMDRFGLDAEGKPLDLPPINVPGYPVARVGGDAALERWISVEPFAGAMPGARVHRLQVVPEGAAIEQSLELSDRFVGFVSAHVGTTHFGIALSEPENACGAARLTALSLGASDGSSSEPMTVASTFELPSDDWQLVAADGPNVLVRRDRSYALVTVDSSGSLALVGIRSTDAYLNAEQLSGNVLRGAGDVLGRQTLEF